MFLKNFDVQGWVVFAQTYFYVHGYSLISVLSSNALQSFEQQSLTSRGKFPATISPFNQIISPGLESLLARHPIPRVLSMVKTL